MRIHQLALAASMAVAANTATAGTNEAFNITIESVVSGVNRPVAIRNADDGSDRLFVVEQSGAIRIISNGQLLSTPFLSVDDSCCGEQGLLGLAFHPNYANNGFFYLNQTDPSSEDTVITRYQVSGANADVANPNSRLELMTIVQDFGNHNGGDLNFGPDGFLYVGMGDGGSGGDPCNRSQRINPNVTTDPDSDLSDNVLAACTANDSNPTSALLGKMIRIDVDSTTPAGSNNLCAAAGNGSAPYAIPASNPFADDNNACGEIWAVGLRNPFRFSFDKDNGDLFIGDVGQNDFEEISFLPAAAPAGANFGWDCEEGDNVYPGDSSTDCLNSGPLTPPIADYTHNPDGLCSITGGYRYRGPIANLQGLYIHSDFCRNDLFFLQQTAGSNWSKAAAIPAQSSSGANINSISGFGESEDGSLYLLSLNGGTVYTISSAVGSAEFIFENGFE